MERCLTLPERKLLRASVVARYAAAAGYPGVVVFSCGNAARALQSAGRLHGLTVVPVHKGGPLVPGAWWEPAAIHEAWPTFMDATSGHLPAPLMVQLAGRLREHLGPLDRRHRYVVPTGSGETVLCLAMAYPGVDFVAAYDDTVAATRWEPGAPLNTWVEATVPTSHRWT